MVLISSTGDLNMMSSPDLIYSSSRESKSMVSTPTMSIIRSLTQDWSFTQVGGGKGTKDDEWLAAAQFPTTVHVELLHAERIPDPVCPIVNIHANLSYFTVSGSQ